MCSPSRNKAWIAAASSARPNSSDVKQLTMERWCGVLGVEQCWLLVAVFSELNAGSHKVANRNICSCMRRITSLLILAQDHIHVKCFYVHSLPQVSIRLNFVCLNFVCLNLVWLNFVCLNFVCLNFVCLNFDGLGADTVLGGPRDPPQ